MLKIFLWGTGHIANEVLQNREIFEKYDVVGFIDNESCKQGKKYMGKHIFAPEILLKIKVDKIVILTVRYEEIYQQIVYDLKLKSIAIEDWKYFYKQLIVKPGVLKRYRNVEDWEIINILKYINQNDFGIFNNHFREKYNYLNISTFYDENCGMYYCIYRGKKMYFKKSLDTASTVVNYYRSILVEQDEDSPHRYIDKEFKVHFGDIVIDAGVAEGNFALEIIDRVSKIYLIEIDEEWIEALKETFKDYQDKVVIIPQYLTSMDDGIYATLDSLIQESVNFIKMDLEGNEWDALLGAEKLIKKSKNLQCAICSYHTEYDETLIKAVLEQYGLLCGVTQSYMWFPSCGRDGRISTKLRRGVVRGRK